MIRSLVLTRWLAALSLCAAAPAQRQIHAINDLTTCTQWQTWSGTLRAISFTVAVTAVQVFQGPTAGSHVVSLWDADPTTGSPRMKVAEGSFIANGPSPGFAGTTLNAAVTLNPMTPYFVVIGGGRLLCTSGTAITPYYQFTGGVNWNGPYFTERYSVRLFTGPHAARWSSFLSGRAGTQGHIPSLELRGWAMTGNSIGFHLANVQPSVPLFLVIGSQNLLTFPFATLYQNPDVVIATTTTSGANPPGGMAAIDAAIPFAPALSGLLLGAQAFVVDPGAAFSLAYSTGVYFTVIH